MTEQPKRSFVSGVIFPMAYILGLFVLVVLLFRLNQANYNYIQQNSSLLFTPLGTSSTGEAATPVLYLVGTMISTFGLVYVLRKRLQKGLTVFMLVIFLVLSFSLGAVVLSFLPIGLVLWVSFLSWSLLVLVAYRNYSPYLVFPFVTLISAEFGVTLTIVLPRTSIFVFPILYACWDIFAVFRGPLKQIASSLSEHPIPPLTTTSIQTSPPAPKNEIVIDKKSRQQFRTLFVLKLGSSSIGFGDLFFYSMIVALACTFASALIVSITVGLILVGVGITFSLLRSNKHLALPGLPIPVFLSMVFLIAVFLR